MKKNFIGMIAGGSMLFASCVSADENTTAKKYQDQVDSYIASMQESISKRCSGCLGMSDTITSYTPGENIVNVESFYYESGKLKDEYDGVIASIVRAQITLNETIRDYNYLSTNPLATQELRDNSQKVIVSFREHIADLEQKLSKLYGRLEKLS